MFKLQFLRRGSVVKSLPKLLSSVDLGDEHLAVIDQYDQSQEILRVSFQGTVWSAFCLSSSHDLYPGKNVYIVGIDGIRLLFR